MTATAFSTEGTEGVEICFAHSQGIVSSRGVEWACAEHVTFIALSGAPYQVQLGIRYEFRALGVGSLRLSTA